MWISSVNTTSFLVEWTPSFLWEGYIIDYYNINVTVADSIFSAIKSHIPQLIYVQNSSTSVSCTLLYFSISAVNRDYGESDSITAAGGLDASMYQHVHACMNFVGTWTFI